MSDPFAAAEIERPLRRVDLPGGTSVAFTAASAGNLGLHVGAGEKSQQNRRELESVLGLERGSLVFLEQVHGAEVADADEAPLVPPGVDARAERRLAPVADAAVTREGRPLAVMTADCLPVVFTTDEPRIFAVAHAGRKGLLSGVLREAVDALREAGAGSIDAWFGPSICGPCYEVPQEMADESEQQMPGIAITTRWGTPGLDLPGAAQQQLKDLGVSVHREGLNACTYEDASLFSHRRDPGQGRIAGLVWSAESFRTLG